MAERVIAKLRRKVPKFALLVGRDVPAESERQTRRDRETFEVLCGLGHSRSRRPHAWSTASLGTKKKFTDVQELLQIIYDKKSPVACGSAGRSNTDRRTIAATLPFRDSVIAPLAIDRSLHVLYHMARQLDERRWTSCMLDERAIAREPSLPDLRPASFAWLANRS